MKKNHHLMSLVSTVGLALIVVSIPLNADTPPAPADQGASQLPADLQQALAMPAGPDQNKAVTTAAKAWAEKDAKGFVTWAFPLPMPLFGAASGANQSCGKSPSIKDAADWLNQQDSPKLTLFLHPVMLGWAHEDAASAEAWCLQVQPNKDHRYVAIFTVADALCRKKATDAVAWTATITPQDDRCAAIDGTVTIWIRGDLPGMTTWIKQLNPVDMKWAALVAARNWRSKDPTLAAWLDGLSLSADDKAAVLKGPYPDSYNFTKYGAAPASAPSKP